MPDLMPAILRSIRETVTPSPEVLDAPSRHFYWVDCVRGLAALSVLVWHYQHLFFREGFNPEEMDRSIQPFYVPLRVLYEHGGEAVQLFWVISGFVFANVYLKSRRGTGEAFVAHRIARLYPLHLATLLAVAALQLLSLRQTGNFQIYRTNDAYHFLLHLLFIPAWGLERDYSFNAPIWSVSVELLVYAVYWFCLPMLIKRGLLGAMALVVLFLGAQLLDIPSQLWWCGVFFFLGCSVFLLWRTWARRTMLLAGLALAGLAAGYGASQLNSRYAILLFMMTAYPALVLLVAVLESVDTARFGKRFRSVGDLTYSSYLLHIPIQIGILLLFNAWGVDRTVVRQGWFFLAFMATVIASSLLCYRYFELPSRNWLRSRLGG